MEYIGSFIEWSINLNNSIYAGISSAVFRSINGGLKWNLIYGNPETGGFYVNSIKINISNPNELWIAGETGRFAPFLRFTSDNGDNWISNFSLPPLGPYGVDNAIYDIAIDNLHEGTVYLGMLGLIIKTTDYGKNWEKVLGWDDGIYRNWSLEINPNSTNQLIATVSYLYQTINSGKNWIKVKPPDDRIALYALIIDWETKAVYVSTSSPKKGIFQLKF